MFSESHLDLRSEQTLKRQKPGEQQQSVCAARQTSAINVVDLEKCVDFSSLNWVREIRGPNNN